MVTMVDSTVKEIDGGVVFAAKIVPAGSKTVVCGLLNGMVKIKVAAAREKGKANQCLIEFLAKKLDVKKRDISIIFGLTNPVKNIQVLGMSAQMLLNKLNLNKQDNINE